MATHCSILAWRIPRTGEPGGLQSMGSESDMTKQLSLTKCRRPAPAPPGVHIESGSVEHKGQRFLSAYRVPGRQARTRETCPSNRWSLAFPLPSDCKPVT